MHCVQDTKGAEFHPDLIDDPRIRIISKGLGDTDCYSAFDETDLAMQLKELGVEEVWVGGLATDYCVKSTVLDALKEGFRVKALTDAMRAVEVEARRWQARDCRDESRRRGANGSRGRAGKQQQEAGDSYVLSCLLLLPPAVCLLPSAYWLKMATLNIDRYHAAMGDASYKDVARLHNSDLSDAQATFYVTQRKMPFAPCLGHERLVRLLIDSQIDRPRLRFLEQDRGGLKLFAKAIEDIQFVGSVRAVRPGVIVFANQPFADITGAFGLTQAQEIKFEHAFDLPDDNRQHGDAVSHGRGRGALAVRFLAAAEWRHRARR